MLAVGQGAPHDTTAFAVILRFDVTDTTPSFERPLGSSLLLRVRRESRRGWVVSVVRRSSEPDQPNLLYHSRRWHGPYPTDVLAWSFQRQYFPNERILPVYGYPYEVRIRLIDCRTSGSADDVVFVAGTIELAWRRAPIRHAAGA
jgi:hypothetical protein